MNENSMTAYVVSAFFIALVLCIGIAADCEGKKYAAKSECTRIHKVEECSEAFR